MLDSCRIGWAGVLEVEPEQLLVRMSHLEYDGQRLSLGAARQERIDYRVADGCFVDEVVPGDQVAVHWGFACDRLTGEQAASLERWTCWQLDAMAPRLTAG